MRTLCSEWARGATHLAASMKGSEMMFTVNSFVALMLLHESFRPLLAAEQASVCQPILSLPTHG